jgi:serine/threonine protein kinase
MVNKTQDFDGYCVVYRRSDPAEKPILDLYIPNSIADRMQLAPLSRVMAYGLNKDADPILIRSIKLPKGLKNDQILIYASVQLPNSPHTLEKLLDAFRMDLHEFYSINTLRQTEGSQMTVFFETSVLAPSKKVEDVEKRFNEICNSQGAECLWFEGFGREERVEREKEVERGVVDSSMYRLRMPILNDYYKRISVPSNKRGFLKHILDKPTIAQIRFDEQTALLEIRTTNTILNPYVFEVSFSTRTAGEHATQRTLNTLPDSVNVDYIEAYETEIVNRDLRIEREDEDDLAEIGGAIKFLGYVKETLDTTDLKTKLNTMLAANDLVISHDPEPVKIFGLNNRLLADLRPALDESGDTFEKVLNDGRYVYIGPLGGGGGGNVGRYFDSWKGQLVAAKHLVGSSGDPAEEIRVSHALTQTHASHFAELLDVFRDGKDFVIVSELMDGVLSQHVENPHRNLLTATHDMPSSFKELDNFVVQMCAALKELVKILKGVNFIHADLKPENIGWVHAPPELGQNPDPVRERNELTWKILDLGALRRLPTEKQDVNQPVETTPGHYIGTGPYMSPEAAADKKHLSNDVFSLGIIIFRLICDWGHPSEAGIRLFDTGRSSSRQEPPMPLEIRNYAEFVIHRKEDPDRYAGYSFDLDEMIAPKFRQNLSDDAITELQRIIDKSISLRLAQRYKKVEEFEEDWLKFSAVHLAPSS